MAATLRPTSTTPLVRLAPDGRAVALMVLLSAIWGIQQVLIKSVVADVAPVMQLAIRFAGASIFFGALVFASEGRSAFNDGAVASGLLLGLMFSLEFVFGGSALLHTSAAHAIVFLYSAPIFTALGLQFLPDERLDALQWAGIAIAVGGIAVAFIGPGGRPVAELMGGDLTALLSGIAWGLSNVVLRLGRIGSTTTAKTVFYQVVVATFVLLVFASVTGQTHVVMSGWVVIFLLFQTLVIGIGSYLTWFWLLRRYLTSRLMLLSLLTPLFGVAFGAFLLREVIEPRFALGAALVLAGILIVNAQLIRVRIR